MKKLLLITTACLGVAWHIGLFSGGTTASVTPRLVVSVGNIYPGSADVLIQNKSGARVASAFMHCTFRDANGTRIDAAPILVSDLAPNDTAKTLARMPNDIRAASVVCG